MHGPEEWRSRPGVRKGNRLHRIRPIGLLHIFVLLMEQSLKDIKALTRLNWSALDTLVFAGGGNRCWWQAGALSVLTAQGLALPPRLIGTSAGAAVAASFLTDGPKAAFEACQRLYLRNQRIWDWRALTRLKLRFAHQHTYPAWVAAFVNADNFDAIRTSRTQLRVAITRPARWLGLQGSMLAGTLAYIVDKHVSHSIHPRLPKWLGLRQDFLDLHGCADAGAAQALLAAAAAAPPFMHATQIGGQGALDGGYTDNAPIPAQNESEKTKTLVLLTRHYPQLPSLFRWNGRSYWQPSQPVPVSTWDCTARATVTQAYALGETDAVALCARALRA
jgi:predicted acylesterase/phospholipase RssA